MVDRCPLVEQAVAERIGWVGFLCVAAVVNIVLTVVFRVIVDFVCSRFIAVAVFKVFAWCKFFDALEVDFEKSFVAHFDEAVVVVAVVCSGEGCRSGPFVVGDGGACDAVGREVHVGIEVVKFDSGNLAVGGGPDDVAQLLIDVGDLLALVVVFVALLGYFDGLFVGPILDDELIAGVFDFVVAADTVVADEGDVSIAVACDFNSRG